MSAATAAEDTHFYLFRSRHQKVNPDPDLVRVIAEHLERVVHDTDAIEFNISHRDFYSVMKSVDAFNAPLLIEHGLREDKEVIDFLNRNGLAHLIRKNSKIVARAKKRKVLPGNFVNLYCEAYLAHNTTDETLAAIDFYAEVRKHSWFVREMVFPVIRRVLRYEDLKAIGFANIEYSMNRSSIKKAMELAATDPQITIEHIQKALKARHDKSLDHHYKDGIMTKAHDLTEEKLLELIMVLGGETALKLSNPVYLSRSIHRSRYEGLDRHELTKVYEYADKLRTATYRKADPSPETLALFMNEGVDLSLAAQGLNSGWSNDRIMAVHSGIAPSLTDGWI